MGSARIITPTMMGRTMMAMVFRLPVIMLRVAVLSSFRVSLERRGKITVTTARTNTLKNKEFSFAA